MYSPHLWRVRMCRGKSERCGVLEIRMVWYPIDDMVQGKGLQKKAANTLH